MPIAITFEMKLKKDCGTPEHQLVAFLRDSLEISYNRAKTLVALLQKNKGMRIADKTTKGVPVTVSEAQFGRFVAFRWSMKLINGVAWPDITEFMIESYTNENTPIELRPGRRIIPSQNNEWEAK